MSQIFKIVLIGETGSGKSTFINYLCNLFENGSLRKPHIVVPNEFYEATTNVSNSENNVNDRTTSKTTECKHYEFKNNIGTFDFLDTPGISDTGGYLKDNENVDKIFSEIRRMEEVNALILIMNGTYHRLTQNISNVLERFRNSIPDIFTKNMIVILTNCEGYSVNFRPDSQDFLKNCPRFVMQNSAFSCAKGELSEEEKSDLKKSWKESMKTLGKIIDHLGKVAPLSIDSFRLLNDERNRMKDLLHEYRLTILELHNVHNNLLSMENISAACAQEQNKFQNYCATNTVGCWEYTATDYHNTLCEKCNMVCHEKCTLEETHEMGANELRFCCVFPNRNWCVQCQCHLSHHYHARKLIHYTERSMSYIINSIYAKFENAKKNKEHFNRQCSSIQETKSFLEVALQNQCEEIETACRTIRKTCSGYNVAEDLSTFITQLGIDCAAILSSPITRSMVDNLIKRLITLCEELKPSDRSLITLQRTKSLILSSKEDSLAKRNLQRSKSHISDEEHEQGHNLFDAGGKHENKSLAYIGTRDKELEDKNPENNNIPVLTNDCERCSGMVENDVATLTNDMNHKFHNEENDTTFSESSGNELFANTGRSAASCAYPEDESTTPGSSVIPIQQYTTQDIMKLLCQCDISAEREIDNELRNRCDGESVGFLSRTQLYVFGEKYAQYQQMKTDELSRAQRQLKRDVQRVTNKDSRQIQKLSSDLLLTLAAIDIILEKRDDAM